MECGWGMAPGRGCAADRRREILGVGSVVTGDREVVGLGMDTLGSAKCESSGRAEARSAFEFE